MEKNPHPVTIEHLTDDEKLSIINKELKEGFCYIHNYDRSVTFFGSVTLYDLDLDLDLNGFLNPPLPIISLFFLLFLFLFIF